MSAARHRLRALAASGFFLQEAELPEPATTKSSRRALLAPLGAIEQRVYAIRTAVPSDTEALVALEAECWEAPLLASRTEIASRLGDPACTTYVAVLRTGPLSPIGSRQCCTRSASTMRMPSSHQACASLASPTSAALAGQSSSCWP